MSKRLVIDIGDRDIKILVGNKMNISKCDTIQIPEGCIEDFKILNMDLLCELLDNYLIENKINTTQVSFVIDGTDISVRFMEVPIMNNKSIMELVEWELNEYLPELGNNSYFDYEIIEKIKTEDKKVYKLFVVAAPKERVEQLLELTKRLDLKLTSIDMASNCTARVFKNVHKIDNKLSEYGILTLGKYSSSFIIIDSCKPFVERKVPFDVVNVLDELHNQIYVHFDNVFSTYERVIQFYTNGKVKKTLDKIFILADGLNLNGIDKYIEKYFSTGTEIINSQHMLMIKSKFPHDRDFREYINCLGILLRKE